MFFRTTLEETVRVKTNHKDYRKIRPRMSKTISHFDIKQMGSKEIRCAANMERQKTVPYDGHGQS